MEKQNKKWQHEKIIKLNDLKKLILNFQLATNLNLTLKDENFESLLKKNYTKKLCSFFLENNITSNNNFCCDTVSESYFNFNSEGFSIVKCKRNLSFFIIPLKLENNLTIGYLTSEPVFLDKNDKINLIELLKDKKIIDHKLNYEGILKLVNEIDIVSLENLKAKANFLMDSVNLLIKSGIKEYEIKETESLLIENYKLKNKAEEEVKRLTTLNKVSAIINSSLDLTKVLQNTVKIISDLMQVEICSIMLLKENCNHLKIVAAAGLDENIIQNSLIAVGEGISGYVAKTGKPLWLTDISSDPVFSKYLKTSADYKTSSVLSVPLKIKDKVIGVINVNNKKNLEVFTDSDLQLLETLATQISVAIENARLYSQKEQKLNEVIMLHNLGLAINSTLEIKTIVKQIIKNLKQFFNVDTALVMLLDDSRENLKIIAQTGINDIKNISFVNDIAKFVMTKKIPILISNTQDNTNEILKKFNNYNFNLLDPTSIMVVPIIVKKNIEGIIYCEKRLKNLDEIFTQDNLNLLITFSFHVAVAIENSTLYNNLMSVYLETIQSLANALEAKDSYTHGHSKRVAAIALAIASEMKLNEVETSTLKHAALLHDIGKIGISESILQKPSKLSDDEFLKIKDHPILGAKILETVEFLKSVCLQIKHHHERYDGKGYPLGLKGKEIPLGSRIIAIADAYDAMTSTRPYRMGLLHEVALSEIKKGSGTQFDPQLVNIFLKIADKCHKIIENIENETDNIINIVGIKNMFDGLK